MAIWGKQGGQPVVLPAEDILEDLYPGAVPIDFDEKNFTVYFKTPNGSTNSLNIKDYYAKMAPVLKEAGSPPITVTKATSFNQQDNALQDSPATFFDRLKMSFSVNQDRPEGIKNIRKDFQDAQITGDGTLVVKEKGIWKRIDPSGLDPGDAADMVGYLIPLGLGGIAATMAYPAAATSTALSGPAAPIVGPLTGIGATGVTAAAGMGGEAIRQKIGESLGVKKPGIHAPSVALEGASWLTAPMVNKMIGKTWAGPLLRKGQLKSQFDVPGVKEGLKHVSTFLFEHTAGVPREVTMYVLEHPEVLKENLPLLKSQLANIKMRPKKMTPIKLPNGEIYKLSGDARDKLLGALSEAGVEIEDVVSNSPKIKDLQIDKNEFLGDLLTNPEKMINEVWGGVDRFTPKQRSFIAELAQDLERKAGTQTEILHSPYPTAITGGELGASAPKVSEFISFNKAHNLKQKIYNFIDFNSEGNDGDAFLLSFAGKVNDVLGTKVPEYRIANEKYGGYRELSKNFFQRIPKPGDKIAMAQATDNISNRIKKSVMGKAGGKEEEILRQLEEKTGIGVSSGAKQFSKGIETQRNKDLAKLAWDKVDEETLKGKYDVAKRAQTEFNKPLQWGPYLSLQTLGAMGGAAQMASGGGSGALGGAATIGLPMAAAFWPQMARNAINATQHSITKGMMGAANRATQPLIGSPVKRNILSKTLSDLLTKQLRVGK